LRRVYLLTIVQIIQFSKFNERTVQNTNEKGKDGTGTCSSEKEG
jgi:hypothetical protein